MTCHEENWEPHTSVPLKLRLQLRLRVIGETGTSRLQNAKDAKFGRLERYPLQKILKTKRKVLAWKKELQVLNRKVLALGQKHKTNPDSVTIEDWENTFRSSEKRMEIVFGKKYPRSDWPEGVLYLNFVAYRLHHWKLRAKRAAANPIEEQAPKQQDNKQYSQDGQMHENV